MTDEVSKADKFLAMEATAKTLREAEENYNRTIAEEHIDKYGFAFTAARENRWRCFSTELHLESHKGRVGNPSAYTFLRVEDPGVAAEALVEYLNRHKWEVLRAMADIIEETSQGPKERYVQTLMGELARLAGRTGAVAP